MRSSRNDSSRTRLEKTLILEVSDIEYTISIFNMLNIKKEHVYIGTINYGNN